MRVLVVGSGGVGDAVARIAARRDFFELMVLADYDVARAEASVAAARAATDAAADASREAARRSREVVRELRAEGYSVADTAAILGVSRGRISQLAHG